MRVRPALLLAGLAAALAPTLAARAQGAAFDLLRLEPTARGAALAGAHGALATDDPAALFANPALGGEAMHRGLSVGYLNHLADVNAGFVAYGRTLPGVGTVVAGLRYLSYGDFERADEGGVRDGSSFGAGTAALTVAAAREVAPGLQAGAALHAAFATLDDAGAQALALDLGARYDLPGPALALSASVRNLGLTLSSLGATGDELPLDVRVGVTKQLRYVPLSLSVVGYDLAGLGGGPEGTSGLDGALRHVAVGGELRLGEPVAVRLGYSPRLHQELATGERLDLAGLSAGFGLAVRRFAFDYAYNAWSSFGGLHQLSVRTRL